MIVDVRKFQEAEESVARSEISWRNHDWTGVGETLSSFPALNRVVIGFESREDMIDFDEVAKRHMSRLRRCGVFMYALWDPNEPDRYGEKGTWLRVSPDLDDIQGMIFALDPVLWLSFLV